MFSGSIFFFQFLWKPYSICSKKLHDKIIKNETNWTFFACFLGKKCFFLELQKILNQSVLQKGLLLQDWVFRLGKFLLDPKSHFLSLDKLIYELVFFSKNYIKMYKKSCPHLNLNPGPSDWELLALPTELRRLSYGMWYILLMYI